MMNGLTKTIKFPPQHINNNDPKYYDPFVIHSLMFSLSKGLKSPQLDTPIKSYANFKQTYPSKP